MTATSPTGWTILRSRRCSSHRGERSPLRSCDLDPCAAGGSRHSKTKGPGDAGARCVLRWSERGLVHPAHAAARRTRRRRLVFLLLHDHAFGREQQPRDGRGVLERRAGDLGRVDDARLDQILVRVGRGVVAEVLLLRLPGPWPPRSSPRRPRSGRSSGCGSSSARRTMSTPIFSSSVPLILSSALWARSSATPPPGTMPSSTAARVACSASSTRAFFSFISVSVAAPTLMTATPPESLASRSCSFSLS